MYPVPVTGLVFLPLIETEFFQQCWKILLYMYTWDETARRTKCDVSCLQTLLT